MTLQSAKFLFKLALKAQKNEKIAFPFDYLNKSESLLAVKGRGTSVACFTEQDMVIEEAVALRAILHVSKTLQAEKNSTASKEAKEWELFARMKVDMIRMHMEEIQLAVFKDRLSKTQIKCPKIKELMAKVYRLAGLHSLASELGDLYECGYFAPSAQSNIRSAIDLLVAQLRPQLIPLVEASQINEVPSNIGNKYGDVYELQLHEAMNSPMNKLDKNGVPPQWEAYIKPILHGKL
jgi:acyl-CoA oxidase